MIAWTSGASTHHSSTRSWSAATQECHSGWVRPTADSQVRAALRAYTAWAVDEMLSYLEREDVPARAPMPHWSWDGLQAPTGSV